MAASVAVMVHAAAAETQNSVLGIDIHQGAVTARDADTQSIYGEGLPVYPTKAACQVAMRRAIQKYAGKSHAEGNYGWFLCSDWQIWTTYREAALRQQDCRQHYDVDTGKVYYGYKPSRPTPAPAVAPPAPYDPLLPEEDPLNPLPAHLAKPAFCGVHPTFRKCPEIWAWYRQMSECWHVAQQSQYQYQQNAYAACMWAHPGR